MSNSNKQQVPEDALADARDLLMEAQLDEAMAKFKEAAAAASKETDGGWSERLAAETGQAEVLIQQKNWAGAADQLAKAFGAVADDAGDDEDEEQKEARLRDLTRARYLLGLAQLGQKKPKEALTEFKAARQLAESDGSGEECRRMMLPDILERMVELERDPEGDVDLQDDDLAAMAMDFGMNHEEEDYDDEEDDEEDEDEEELDDDDEEEEEDDEAAIAAARAARKRRAAATNGGNDDEDEDEEEEEEEDEEEEEEDEEASGEAVPKKRARQAAVRGAARNRNGGGRGDGDDEEEEEEEEVSSSA